MNLDSPNIPYKAMRTSSTSPGIQKGILILQEEFESECHQHVEEEEDDIPLDLHQDLMEDQAAIKLKVIACYVCH